MTTDRDSAPQTVLVMSVMMPQTPGFPVKPTKQKMMGDDASAEGSRVKNCRG